MSMLYDLLYNVVDYILCYRDGFTCLESGRESCIHKDLVCDTISHCSSGGDERSSAFCDSKWI
jgi:hypothetical protein